MCTYKCHYMYTDLDMHPVIYQCPFMYWPVKFSQRNEPLIENLILLKGNVAYSQVLQPSQIYSTDLQTLGRLD